MKQLIWSSNFVFDSRKVDENSVFIALSEGVRDGNDFAKVAFENGAKFLILSKQPQFEIPKEKYILVKNTLEFITNLAKEKFAEFTKKGVKTIAITGSVGKTTTKDFLFFLLKKISAKSYATEGNFNNHIGLPLTILNAPSGIDFLILEMGMNHLREISHLISIAPTDVRIITNITNAHCGNFEEGINGIAKAKAEILENSIKETIFITSKNLKLTPIGFKGKTLLASEIQNYKAENGKTFFSVNGKDYFFNKIFTSEWLENIAISFKVLESLNLKFPDDISDFSPSKGRGDEYKISKNCILIDESYNASPESMLNSIKMLSLLEGKKLLVLGGMKELGVKTLDFHILIIQEILRYKEIKTVLIGEEFKNAILKTNTQFVWFESPKVLIEEFKRWKEFNFILVKSSNSACCSSIAEFLKNTIK